MSKPSQDLFIYKIESFIQQEIDDLTELTELLGDNGTISNEDATNDILILKQKMGLFKNIKGMVIKASAGTKDLDTTITMNLEEKKLFIRLVKFIIFIRRIFKRKR